MVAAPVCLLMAGNGGVAVARTSAHCSKMPGRVVAANASLEVSRSLAAFGGYGGDGGYVYRACARSGGSYSQHFLLAPGAGVPATVKVAGGYVAMITGTPGGRYVVLLDPAWDTSVSVAGPGGDCQTYDVVLGCPGSPFGIRELALDRLGRLAWVEPYTDGGVRWVRLRVRSQAGAISTVARGRGLNAITSVHLVGDAVRWSAGRHVHEAGITHPRCQVDPATDKVLASSREALVVSEADSAHENAVFRACLRSDGRWRQLYRTEGFSHGTAVSKALAAGARVALNWLTYPEDNHGLLIVDLRSNRWDSRGGGYPGARIDALTSDGSYVYELSPSHDSTLLYAAAPGKPDVQLDEGAGSWFTPFTDVRIEGGTGFWRNAGVARSAPLP